MEGGVWGAAPQHRTGQASKGRAHDVWSHTRCATHEPGEEKMNHRRVVHLKSSDAVAADHCGDADDQQPEVHAELVVVQRIRAVLRPAVVQGLQIVGQIVPGDTVRDDCQCAMTARGRQ